jgi:hypothetical protein
MLMAVLILCSVQAVAETWTNVPLLDSSVLQELRTTLMPTTRTCALQCARSGYGILTGDGRYLKFDTKGNEEVMKLLKSFAKSDHLRVDVDGNPQGDTTGVKSISF